MSPDGENQAEQGKNPVGRPSKYNDTMPAMVTLFCEKQKSEDLLPTHAGFAAYVDVGKTTVERWASDHPEFRVSLDIMNAKQEDTLVNRGLKNEYNSTICKLMLSSNHGYKERTDQTSGDEKIEPRVMDYSSFLAEQAKAGADSVGVEQPDPSVAEGK